MVPGIEHSNDPILQGRGFSYFDTQISRLGGPNFGDIPINRPLCPVFNFQRDGQHRRVISKGEANQLLFALISQFVSKQSVDG